MRLMRPPKAYVLDLNALMNGTPKMDNFGNKCIFLGEKTKVGGGHLVLVPKTFEDTGIMKIANDIESDGPERKLGRGSQQRA
jgi:hypothetical protein